MDEMNDASSFCSLSCGGGPLLSTTFYIVLRLDLDLDHPSKIRFSLSFFVSFSRPPVKVKEGRKKNRY